MENWTIGQLKMRPKTMLEEPSYMMFARANVRDNMPTTPAVVRELLARIDKLQVSNNEVKD